MPVRLICLDLDGTLLGPDKRVSAVCRAALGEARAAGLSVAIASGRHPFNVQELCADLGMPFTAVCLSGALVIADGREVARHPIDEAGMAAAIDAAEACGCYISLSGADFNLCCGVPDWKRRQAATSNGSAAMGPSASSPSPSLSRYEFSETYDGLRELGRGRAGEVLKVALNAPDDASYERLRADFADVPGIECARSDTRWLDVNAAGCTKAEGIEALARALGLTMAEVAAVGDDENDVASIGAVGLGIAMGNAIEPVKAVARLVVADNAHDGAAESIRLAIEQTKE